MASFVEDSDEEYIDDPIKLIDYEEKRIIANNSALIQESIEISDSDVDVETVPSPQLATFAKLARASNKIVSSTLPVTFFQITRNIELLNKCLPLRIKTVDCGKHSWYYRKKYKNIKFEANNSKIKYRNSVEGSVDKEIMKLKIRPVDVESYFKSPIRDMKTALSRQNNDKPSLKNGSEEKKVQPRNINFKKNKGLVGLKIVYDGNVKDFSPIFEGKKQLNEAVCVLQNRDHVRIETLRPHENNWKKQDIQELGDPMPSKTNNHEEKNKSNTDSLKLTNSLNTYEEKQYNVRISNLPHAFVAPKKNVTRKKCCVKTKPKTSRKKEKALKETEETKTAKIDQNTHAYIKGTENIREHEIEIKGNHRKIDKMEKKVSKSEVALGQTVDIKDTVSKFENNLNIYLECNAPVTVKNKTMFGKHNKTKTLEQDLDKKYEKRQNNPKSKIALGQTLNNKKNVLNTVHDLKMNMKYNAPVSILPKGKNKLGKNKVTQALQRNIDARCDQLQQNNNRKFEKDLSMEESYPQQLKLSSDTTSSTRNNIRTYANTKTRSKFVRVNEGNTGHKIETDSSHMRTQLLLNCNSDNKVENNTSHTMATNMSIIVEKSQPNKKSLLKKQAPSIQEKSCEFAQKQELSKQSFAMWRSENLQNQQEVAPTKRVVVYPVSNYNAIAENSQDNLSSTAQEQLSVCNEKIVPSDNGLPIHNFTVPTPIHEKLPNSIPSPIRYQILSPNVGKPKMLSSQLLNKHLVSSQPSSSKTPPSILNHARILIKCQNMELVSNPGQPEKQNGHGNSTPKSLNLIPNLTSTQKGRYLVINKKIIDNQQLEHKQQTNSVPYNFDPNQQHTVPNNKTIQNQTFSQYPVLDMPNKNILEHKGYSTNERPVPYPPPLPSLHTNRRKQNLTQSPYPLSQQPSVITHNRNTLRAPLPNQPSHPNFHVPHKSNEYAQNYNKHSQKKSNLIHLTSQQLKQKKHKSYYLNHNQQTKPNEYGPSAKQNTILNLDTNTVMQPPPLYDYVPRNMTDMDCAYWNGVNYLGDEWQQGYPHAPPLAGSQVLQPTQDFQYQPSLPVSQYPSGLPDFQHLSPMSVSRCPSGPPDFQNLSTIAVSKNPPPLPVSQFPQGPPDFHHPSSLPILQYPPGPLDLHYPPPLPLSQYPSEPLNYQHPLPPPMPQHPPPPPLPSHPPTPPSTKHHSLPSSDPQLSLLPPVAQQPLLPAALQYPLSTPATQHPPAPVHQQPPPPLPHPHPSNQLSKTSTQGSTILGANNNGVVRTINLVPLTTTGPIVATSNKSLDDTNKISVKTKSEMLTELSKLTEIKSPNLKRSLRDSHSELNKFTIKKPVSGPVAKVRKIEGFATVPSSTLKSLNNGYSPPILPIPTYEKTYEYIAQMSSLKEIPSDNAINTMVHKYNDQDLDEILKKKFDLVGFEDVDKAETNVKKISIDEYKNRNNNNNKEETVEDVIKTEIKSESKFVDPDLGYDSDSTVIL